MYRLTPKNVLSLLLYAIPNTLLSFGIVYIINNALAGNEQFLKDYMAMVFIAFIVYTYLINIIFQKALNKYSFKILYDNEKHVFRKILSAPLAKLEKIGSQRFFTAVEDLRTFAFLPYTVTHTVNSLLMLFLCIGYMFSLSLYAALIVVGLIILIAACYFIVMTSMAKKVEKLRLYNEDYYKYVDDVIKGFKELKLSFFRRENLMNRFLIPNRDEARDLDFRINYVFLSINLISQYGLYFVVAVILFILPEWGLLDRSEVIAYVVIILFISGPINNLVNLEQVYTRFLVAYRRIMKFMSDFESGERESSPFDKEKKATFKSVEFRDITFSYDTKHKQEKSFALGPINLKITQGEVVFIIGGNGSGKSTFINTLTGLYTPSGGKIVFNEEYNKNPQEQLQQNVAAVFTDNHIFSHNYEDFALEGNERYTSLLTTMKMDEVVIDDKEESARRKFSKGQSKRMSFIFALLENKPLLILDEWAADQDPHFRKFFYEMLIPKFKAEGKTIIAVTHDDAYFHQADRIIKFNYGKIEKDVRVKESPLAAVTW